MKRLADIYREYFEVYPEVYDQPDQLTEVYRLRYQVYCIENPFEDPSEHGDGLERDQFDQLAIHSLLVHRQSNTPAGTVRLVFPDTNHPQHLLPIDHVCADPILKDSDKLPRATLAEVSRFAVSKAFRRRRGEFASPSGVGPDWEEKGDGEQKRVIPHLSLGLIRALVQNSHKYGITHWCAEMEPSLLRMLRHIGIYFVNLGPPIEFHGIRQPCYAELDSMLNRVHEERPDVWELITDDGRLWPKCRIPVKPKQSNDRSAGRAE